MQARPDKIGAFNREVWANCPAAPAAVTAVRRFTVLLREGAPRNICRPPKPEDLPHTLFSFVFPRGRGSARQIRCPRGAYFCVRRAALHFVCAFFRCGNGAFIFCSDNKL